MAGFYPDVPAPRMAYDTDGTVGLLINAGDNSITVFSQTDLNTLNDDSDSIRGIGQRILWRITFLFPQARDIGGYFLGVDGYRTPEPREFQTSTDTTNGVDGTWTTIANPMAYNRNVVPYYRSEINAVSATAVTAVRLNVYMQRDTSWLRAVHLYGTISAGETPDRLRLWHPTLDEPLDDNTSADGAWLDWGDVTQGTTADKQFRIKNESTTLTANDINLSTNTLTDATVSIPPQITYSNGGAFSTTLAIGNLAPGAISPVITVRRTTPTNATLNVWTWRLLAEATSWS